MSQRLMGVALARLQAHREKSVTCDSGLLHRRRFVQRHAEWLLAHHVSARRIGRDGLLRVEPNGGSDEDVVWRYVAQHLVTVVKDLCPFSFSDTKHAFCRCSIRIDDICHVYLLNLRQRLQMLASHDTTANHRRLDFS